IIYRKLESCMSSNACFVRKKMKPLLFFSSNVDSQLTSKEVWGIGVELWLYKIVGIWVGLHANSM
ncbi:hypothetical protein, partial [Pleomorphochaeta sp. DL1XJH-081]|uniref:hypothetical protein n=1 Tax=Pleomorphochaeta sp. DL1XJH-081 TaxID=3409690 RepID=UPI003BB62139